MRLPLIAFALAKQTHAPNCTGLFEGGIIRDVPSPELLYTMEMPKYCWLLWKRHSECYGSTGSRRGTLRLHWWAEVDRYGNLNTSVIGDWKHPSVRLPGSGGAADIAYFLRDSQSSCNMTLTDCVNV